MSAFLILGFMSAALIVGGFILIGCALIGASIDRLASAVKRHNPTAG